MLLYGVLDADGKSVIEFFAACEEAEAYIAEVEGDEPETASQLRVAAVEFERVLNRCQGAGRRRSHRGSLGDPQSRR